jgi:hypothetical protein
MVHFEKALEPTCPECGHAPARKKTILGTEMNACTECGNQWEA